MPKIWRNRIIAGTKTYAQCPARYKDQVKELLKHDVEQAVISPERYEELVGEPYNQN